MMKSVFVFLIFTLLKLLSVGQDNFTVYIGTSDQWESGSTVYYDANDTTIMVTGEIAGRPLLAKLSMSGDTLWTKRFSSFVDGANDFHRSSTGNYVLVGGSAWVNPGWFMKADVNGNCIEARLYGLQSGTGFSSIVENSDGSFTMAGSVTDYDPGMGCIAPCRDLSIVNTTPSGEILWNRTYGKEQKQFAIDAVQANGGNLIVSVWHGGLFNEFPELICLDALGNEVWAKRYNMNPEGLLKISPNRFLAYNPTMLFTFDSLGSVISTKKYGTGEFTIGAIKLSIDGNLLIAGVKSGVNASVYILKIDTNLGQLWNINLAMSNITQLNDILELPDSSLLFTGSAYGDFGGRELILMKSNSSHEFYDDSVSVDVISESPVTNYIEATELLPERSPPFTSMETTCTTSYPNIYLNASDTSCHMPIFNLSYVNYTPQFYFNSNAYFADSVYWDFGDGDFSSDMNPSHVYLESGNYNVCLTVFGCDSSVMVCDSLDFQAVNIRSTFTREYLMYEIYPNPSDGTFTMSSPVPGSATIYDLMGRKVYNELMVEGINEVTVEGNGIYLVTVEDEKGIVFRSKVIERN